MVADPCPPTKRGEDWAAGCFQADGDGRRVKPHYLKRLTPDRRGITTVMIEHPRELVAVDRRGKVVVPGIRHTGDFDYRDAEGGIGRFETGLDGKTALRCGYFDSRTFRIVIPAEYDQCQAFAGGEALVCKGCVSRCDDADCHHSTFVGGDGFALGPDGTIRERFKPTGKRPDNPFR